MKCCYTSSTWSVFDELLTDEKNRKGEAARANYPQFLKVHGDSN